MTDFFRRTATIALALCVAGGCSSAGTGNTNYAQFYQIAKQSISASFGKIRITRDQAAAIPYASLGYTLDGSNQALLVLATDANGEMLWTSPSHVVIATRDGRVVRTVGLPHDLANTTMPGAPPPPLAAITLKPSTTTRQEDFPDLGLYSISISCSARLTGRQKITILGQAINTNRVDENCQSQNLEWAFTDSFWIDPDSGLVWRSFQHIHPKAGTIEIEIFRPPG